MEIRRVGGSREEEEEEDRNFLDCRSKIRMPINGYLPSNKYTFALLLARTVAIHSTSNIVCAEDRRSRGGKGGGRLKWVVDVEGCHKSVAGTAIVASIALLSSDYAR